MAAAGKRTFPHSPRSTATVELGDLIPTELSDGDWGCLQVTDLKRTGPSSRSSLVVGVLPWVGKAHPRAADVEGLAVIQQGLVGIDLFTKGSAVITANAALVDSDLTSPMRDFDVGTISQVWGYMTALRLPEQLRNEGWPPENRAGARRSRIASIRVRRSGNVTWVDPARHDTRRQT